MSTFDEEKRSIESVRKFLWDLINSKETPRVPKYVRDRARRVIKHYPLSLDMFVDKWYNEMSKENSNES